MISITIILLSACDGGEKRTPVSSPILGTSGTTADPVTITFACYGHELDAYEELIVRFETANPTIRVNLISLERILGASAGIRNLPEDATLRVMSAADTAHWFASPRETQRGLIRDLAPFVNADAAFDTTDFYAGLLEAFQWDSGIWSLPAGAEFTLFFFDKDAFDQTGVPYPEPGWSWDDFVARAEALTEQGEEITRYGYVSAWGLNLLASYLFDHDTPLVDRTTVPSVPMLNSPEVAQGVQWYASLVQAYQVMPYFPQSEGASQAVTLIEGGQAAMWTDFAGSYAWRSQLRNLGVAPFPASEEAGATPLLVDGHVMSAGTSHPDEAWRWLKYLSYQEPVGLSPGSVPARRSVAEASGFWEELADDVAEVYRYALDHALVHVPTSLSPTWMALEQAVETVLQDGRDVGEALAEAQQAALAEQAREMPVVEIRVASPLPGSDIDGEAPTVITFIKPFGELTAYYQLADTFHEHHPDIAVRGRSGPEFEDWYGLPEMASAGDCFSWGAGVDAENASYILRFDPFLDNDSGFSLDDFYPVFLGRCKWQGNYWCLPSDGHVYIIRYNKNLFDATGITYPQAGWTLDDFLITAVALATGKGADRQHGFSSSGFGSGDLVRFIRQQGGSLWDYDALRPKPLFDSPTTIGALQWYADLALVHGVKQAIHVSSQWDRIDESRQALRLAEAGKVAMWSDLAGKFQVKESPEIPTGMVPYPRGSISGMAGAIADAYFISARTEHPEACWEWIKFLSDHLEPVSGVPARRSLAESAMFRQQVGEEMAMTCLYSLAQSDLPSEQMERQSPWTWWANQWFYQAYDAVLDGADATQVLGEAQYKAEEFILCLDAKQGFDDKSTALACALEVDLDYPLPPWEEQSEKTQP